MALVGRRTSLGRSDFGRSGFGRLSSANPECALDALALGIGGTAHAPQLLLQTLFLLAFDKPAFAVDVHRVDRDILMSGLGYAEAAEISIFVEFRAEFVH